ncbi:MAG: hypothetical protein ABL962_18320, partial [Fimbriimonadaceae bacterium]
MLTQLLAMALLAPVVQEPETIVFTQKQTSLTLTYPKAWKVTNSKNNVKFEFPISESDQIATVEIWPAEFSGTTEIWEATQSGIVNQMKQTLVKQWQEEILAVPMLLTRSSYKKNEIDFTTDSAMIYGPSFWKFLYRLTARHDVFDKAEYQWRLVLQSLRPVEGGVLTPFDPNRKALNSERGKGGVKTVLGAEPRNVKPAKVVLGEQSRPAVAGGKTVQVRFPKDWSVEEKEGLLEFSRSGLGSVQVTIQNTVDSPAPNKAFARAGSQSLGLFSKVDSRAESLPTWSKGGMQVAYLWRTGSSTDGYLATLNSVGSLGDFYWLANWKVSKA